MAAHPGVTPPGWDLLDEPVPSAAEGSVLPGEAAAEQLLRSPQPKQAETPLRDALG